MAADPALPVRVRVAAWFAARLPVLAAVLQVAGLALVVVGVWSLAGPAAGLVALGGALLYAGVQLDV